MSDAVLGLCCLACGTVQSDVEATFARRACGHWIESGVPERHRDKRKRFAIHCKRPQSVRSR
jgi:hypothetical protein